MHYALAIFLSIFLTELGDKTQLATILFATDKDHHPVIVFTAASAALVVSTGVAVTLGIFAEKYLGILPLKLLAGIGFIAIGLWTIRDHFVAG